MAWLFRSKLLTLLVLGLLIWGVERLIVTDREAIENLAESLAEDIRAERWDELESRLHEEFRYQRMDRARTVEHVRGLVERTKATGVGVSLYEIEVTGEVATARGHVWGNVAGRPVRVSIDAKLRRDEDAEHGWVLREVSGGYIGR